MKYEITEKVLKRIERHENNINRYNSFINEEKEKIQHNENLINNFSLDANNKGRLYIEIGNCYYLIEKYERDLYWEKKELSECYKELENSVSYAESKILEEKDRIEKEKNLNESLVDLIKYFKLEKYKILSIDWIKFNINNVDISIRFEDDCIVYNEDKKTLRIKKIKTAYKYINNLL